MNSYPIWEDYLALSAHPDGDAAREGERRAALLAWAERPYAVLPPLKETVRWVRAHPDRSFSPLFWQRMVFPFLDPDAGDAADALLLLFEQGAEEEYRKARFPAVPCRRLEEIVLSQYPGAVPVLRSRYMRWTRRLALSVRAVPHAVLYKEQPANRRQTAALSAQLYSYQLLSEQLQIDNREFIACLRILYAAWAAYLDDPGRFSGFADCLRRRRISL